MRGWGEWKNDEDVLDWGERKKDEVSGFGVVVGSVDEKRDLGILIEGIGWLPRVFVRLGDTEIFNCGVGGRSGKESEDSEDEG